jgi:hypothetical protein
MSAGISHLRGVGRTIAVVALKVALRSFTEPVRGRGNELSGRRESGAGPPVGLHSIQPNVHLRISTQSIHCLP